MAGSQREAQALIMAGQVSAEGRRLDKPGLMVDEAVAIHVKPQSPYVSRAGEKLASVTGPLELEFAGKVVLDVGSSTGGFTDYVLQQGAARVICVDVGTGQLDYKLRQDPRVVVMEQTDIRDAQIPEVAEMAVVDVSFVSLSKVLEATVRLLKDGAQVVAMAKPQFEATKAEADRYSGVIPVGALRDEILGRLREWMQERFEILGEHDSAVAGMRGNVERFFVVRARPKSNAQ
jgi:23S rRNA (cytidine1920-2'-O)/16S rRNA (cytidine1409-2'-O)-methyltransferase